MAGGSDENGSKVVQAVIRSPFSAMTLIGGIVYGTVLWMTQSAGLEKVSDRVTQVERRLADAELATKEDKRETTQKLDRLQSDIGDMKAVVRGMSVGIDGLNRNVETLIRQGNRPELARP